MQALAFISPYLQHVNIYAAPPHQAGGENAKNVGWCYQSKKVAAIYNIKNVCTFSTYNL